MEPIIVPITREHEYDITLRAQEHEYDIKVNHGTTISDVVLHRPYHSSQKTLVPLQSGIALSAADMELGMYRGIAPAATQQIGIKMWPANMRREGDAEELYPVETGIGIDTGNISLVGVRGLIPTADGIRTATQNAAINNEYGIVPSADGVCLTTASSKIAKSAKLTPVMSSIETGMSEIDIDIAPNDVEVEIIGQGINYYGSSSTYAYAYAEINNTIYTNATQGIIVHPGDTINIVACSSVSNTTALGSIYVDGVQYSRVAQKSFTVPSGSPKIIIGLAQNVTSASKQYTYAHASTSSDYLIVAITGSGSQYGCTVSYPGSQDIISPRVITFATSTAFPTFSLSVNGTSSNYGEIRIDGVQVKKVTSWNLETYSWAVPNTTRGASINMSVSGSSWMETGTINVLTTSNESSGGGGGGGGTTTIYFTIRPVNGGRVLHQAHITPITPSWHMRIM